MVWNTPRRHRRRRNASAGITLLGLTGGIAMGKSSVAAQLELLGAKALSADAVVHRLLAYDKRAIMEIDYLFPGVVHRGAVMRDQLGKHVFGNQEALLELERILHPLVMREEMRWVEDQRRLGAKLAVLDIPLLFETGAEPRCDYVLTVSAPAFLQRQRALARPGMTEEKLKHILERQLPDAEKRRRADFVIHTGLGKGHAMQQVRQVMDSIQCVHHCEERSDTAIQINKCEEIWSEALPWSRAMTNEEIRGN